MANIQINLLFYNKTTYFLLVNMSIQNTESDFIINNFEYPLSIYYKHFVFLTKNKILTAYPPQYFAYKHFKY